MQFKPLVPTAIALALSWSAIAAAGEASIRTGNISASTRNGTSTVSTSRPASYWLRVWGIAVPTSSRAQAVSRARRCTGTTQVSRTSGSGNSTYQSQTSRVCR